jgi:oxygen-independent coproporphyrinogen-3 oxidase
MSRPVSAQGANASAVGLYLHVPYCATLCSYCDFYRTESPAGIPSDFDRYLIEEGERYREEPRIAVDSVFFGGGTPSLLSPRRLARLMGSLCDIFAPVSGAEVTLEANPETVDAAALEGWRAAGVNRLSLGAQSLNAEELALLCRRAPAEQVRRSVDLAAAAGYQRLSVDLMLGVPGQTPESLGRTLDEVVGWPVDHVSAYLLDLHRGTELFQRVLRQEATLPDEEASADLYDLLCDRLQAAGFRHYEISNFARPGGESRHNLKYWRGEEWIGLGPSAHSCFRGQRMENPRSIERWREALKCGAAPYERSAPVTARERLENKILFGLRLAEGVEETLLQAFLEEQGRDVSAVLDPLVAHGHARRTDEGRLRLTRQGFLVSNEILTFLLPGGWPRTRTQL